MKTERAAPNPSRRSFLIAGGAVAAVIGAGISGVRFAGSREEWVASVIRDNLPGITIERDSFAKFVEEVIASDALKPVTHRLAVFAEQSVPWVAARIPKVRNGLDRLERRVLTEFLLGSNFFRIPNPKQETIVYYGPAIACGNPFVSFGRFGDEVMK
jgi:hypothetical protein